MHFDCEIVGARLFTPRDQGFVVIAIKEGRIAALLNEPSGAAARTIDAYGLVALPGMVDQHVHFMDPGETTREDFMTGSSAAAVGGVTTVVEHTHSKPVLDSQGLTEKAHYLGDRTVVDFGLAAHVFPETIANIEALWDAGATLLKVFTCTTHGVPALLADDLLRLFRSTTNTGIRTLVHCEDEFITEDNLERLQAELRSDFGVITDWRSAEAELVAVNTVTLLARLTGAKTTIAHVSQPEVVDLVLREKILGADITVESCPQYFHLTSDDVDKHGPSRKFTPPARGASARDGLWDCLRSGEIDVISTDHAPSTMSQKFESNIWDCPFGLPGVETTLPLFLNAVNEGRLSLQQIVASYSANPARLIGIFPRKGTIQVGSDADVVLVDMAQEYVIRDEDIVSKAGWSPYSGKRIVGRPVMTMVRGQIVAEDGQVVTDLGYGQFIGRSASI